LHRKRLGNSKNNLKRKKWKGKDTKTTVRNTEGKETETEVPKVSLEGRIKWEVFSINPVWLLTGGVFGLAYRLPGGKKPRTQNNTGWGDRGNTRVVNFPATNHRTEDVPAHRQREK